MSRTVILGAGHAGGSAAAFLRQYGYEGEIVLIGDEALPPYQRPPLSKAWLKGEADAESLSLLPLEFYAEAGIDLRLSTTAANLDRQNKRVQLSNGETLSYDHLILATGSKPRPFPIEGGDHPDLLMLRTTVDAERLKAALQPEAHLILIGAGYVGLEAAASAIALGAKATVIEREARVLARVASEPLSRYFTRLHQDKGVDLITKAEVLKIKDGKTVYLSDGQVLTGDAVLVGIGALAADDLAREAGLNCGNGIVVDHEASTSDPAIFAIGDCAHRPLPHSNSEGRLESVPSALEMAKQAAAAITGHKAPVVEVPWFWSDQYDTKLQIAGLSAGADQVLVRGDENSSSFAVFHLKGDKIVSVEAVNSPADFMGGKLLIAKKTPVDVTKLSDPSHSIKLVAMA